MTFSQLDEGLSKNKPNCHYRQAGETQIGHATSLDLLKPATWNHIDNVS